MRCRPFLSRRLILPISVLLFLCIFLIAHDSDNLCSNTVSGLAIVSLASSLARLDTELPVTVYSLIHQRSHAKQIRVNFPKSEEAAINDRVLARTLSPYLQHPLVKFIFADDLGPATKFMNVLEELIAQGEDAYDQPVIIVDDDHAYSPCLVSTLVSTHRALPGAAIGFRGWRIRKDLHWGVGNEDIDRHIQWGHKLSQPFRVGVLTANEGYLILPRFLASNGSSGDILPPILDKTKLSSTAAHLVDDIWMAGSLSTNRIPRYIVPLPGHASVDITQTHTLEKHMENEGMPRWQANDKTLAMFRHAFEEEDLWYVFAADSEKGAKGVAFRGDESAVWLPAYVRGWKVMKQFLWRMKLRLTFGNIV